MRLVRFAEKPRLNLRFEVEPRSIRSDFSGATSPTKKLDNLNHPQGLGYVLMVGGVPGGMTHVQPVPLQFPCVTLSVHELEPPQYT